jgi:UPF0271 protein
MRMYRIDLNSDLGESFGVYTLGNDEAILESVTSANVACGFHAGDPLVLLKTVETALQKGAAVGAHPGHLDLMGFGRRTIACSPDEVYAYTLYQIGAVQAACKAKGITLQHVKPHGALYNQSAKDLELARAIAHAVRDAGDDIILLGLANSLYEKAAHEASIPYAAEAFADRAYEPEGNLVSRKKEGSVFHDANYAAERVLSMVTEGKVEAIDGSVITLKPQSICLHGDTPEAVDMAKTIKETLEASGVKVCSLKEVLEG